MTDTGPLRGFISTTEAAARLGVSEKTIRNWIEKGKLKAATLNPSDPKSPYRIPESEVTRIIQARTNQLTE